MNSPDTDGTSDAARDERDRALFDRIAEKYAKKDLHPTSRLARKQRLTQTLRVAGGPSSKSVLEVGCGAGFSVSYLQGDYQSYRGLDYSAELIKIAQDRFGQEASFDAVDFHAFQTDERFDLIFMIGVLHHMVDMQSIVDKCATLLKEDGWLVVNEPQPDNPIINRLRSVRARVDSTYSEEQDELRGSELAALFEKAGLKNIRQRPQGMASTPFAEVVLSPALLSLPVCWLANQFDLCAESLAPGLIRSLTWNVVVAGQRGAS